MANPSPIVAARSYLQRGWAPLPIPYQQKRPLLAGWPDLRVNADTLDNHFSDAPQNVGILLGVPSGGLTDVDLDCQEARAVADALLPPTGGIFGRPSALRSHWFYLAEGPLRTVRFRDPTVKSDDPDRAALVELRSTGAQTLVPPSVHPSGELVAWHRRAEPARIGAAELERRVAMVAAAALLARHWPSVGARQDAALALAGGLLHAGWNKADAEALVGAVAKAAGDEELEQRERTASYTARALSANRPTTGWPTLAKLVGDRIVDYVRRWLGCQGAGASLCNANEHPADEANEASNGKQPAQATALVALAREAGVACFRDGQGEPFVSLPVDGHLETWPLRAKVVRHWLARLFYERRGRAPGSQAIQDALQVLDGEARFAGPEYPVAVRLEEHGGRIYLDLGDAAWRVVELSVDGWRIVEGAESPVRFRRPRGMLALPDPVHDGAVEALRPLLNLAANDDFLLIVGWLIGCLYPRGPRAILQLLGEQGSAKSSQARVLRSLVDPNAAPLRTQPREEGDLLIAATNGALVALDNLSDLPRWLSDALCRLATGGGLSKRELYTDADEVLLDARRPVILTAIAEVATASDLLDRALTVTLPPIPSEKRRTEAELDAQIARIRPVVLGGLLDAVVAGLANLPGTRLARRPRLADFATFVEAAAPALGWEPEAFLDAMETARRDSDTIAIEALPIGPALLAFMTKRNEWQGTATELLGLLDEQATEQTRRDREWPKRANRLSAQLRRLGPNLRQVGVWIGSDRRSGGQRLVILTKNREVWDRHHRRHRRDDGGDVARVGDGTRPEGSSPAVNASSPLPRTSSIANAPRDGSDDGDGEFSPNMQAGFVPACTAGGDDIEEFLL